MNQPEPGPDAPPDDDFAARGHNTHPLLWIIVLVAALGFGIYIFNVTGGGETALPVTPASQPVGGSAPAPAAPPSAPAPTRP